MGWVCGKRALGLIKGDKHYSSRDMRGNTGTQMASGVITARNTESSGYFLACLNGRVCRAHHSGWEENLGIAPGGTELIRELL